MTDLNNKKKMTHWQLAVMIAATGIGSQIMLAPGGLIQQAQQGAWISLVVGGVLYFGCAWLMLRLAAVFPAEDLTGYLPRLLGRWLGGVILLWFILVFYLQFVVILRGFSEIITLGMFTRTPEEAVGFLFLVLCIYGALQGWETILRIQQIVFFAMLFPLMGLWQTSALIWQYESMLPILPEDPGGILTGVYTTWSFFSGYEVILLVLPLIYREGVGKVRAVFAAFGCMTVLFVSVVAATIGVLTVKTAVNLTYPSLAVIKGVEVPGTFLERLDVYVLLLWIPVVYDTMVIVLAATAHTLAAWWGRGTPGHYVWGLAALAGIGSYFLDKIPLYEQAGKLTNALGFSFSVIAVPVVLAVALLRGRSGKSD